MSEDLESVFRDVAPAVDFCSLRRVRTRNEGIQVRRGHLQPTRSSDDEGAMLTVHDGGGIGYAATSDLSRSGLREAARRAHEWAQRTQGSTVMDFRTLPLERESGEYTSPVEKPWADTPLSERIDLVRSQEERLRTGPEIVGLRHRTEL